MWWRRITRKQFGDLDMEAAAGALRQHLAKGPRRSDELKALIAARGFPPVTWGGQFGTLCQGRLGVFAS